MASFVPRRVFPNLESLPRSYFLGHHRAGLEKMKTMLFNIDLIIECKDFRVPITSSNPLFEQNLAGKERVIVYTKTDLGHTGTKYKDKVRLKSVRLMLGEARGKEGRTSGMLIRCRSKISLKNGITLLKSSSMILGTPIPCAFCSKLYGNVL